MSGTSIEFNSRRVPLWINRKVYLEQPAIRAFAPRCEPGPRLNPSGTQSSENWEGTLDQVMPYRPSPDRKRSATRVKSVPLSFVLCLISGCHVFYAAPQATFLGDSITPGRY